MTVFPNDHLDGGIRKLLCCKLTQRKIIKKTDVFLVNIYPFTMCFYKEKTLKYGHLIWTKYRDLPCKPLFSVRIGVNRDPK